MNIIQLQDRLKGLPEEALVKYVEQPMGEVPIYLALGELQRRSEMKKRFQASQADKPSVAEQLVAEAKPMQMGLGAMAPQQMMPGAQGVGAPQPTPEIDPRQMAASGIAANPQSAVGSPAMMKEGGIVGYQTGGNIGNIDMSDFEYTYGGLGDALGSLRPRKYGDDQFVRFGDPRTDSLYSPFNIKKATKEDIEAGRMIDRLTGVSVPLVPEKIANKRDKLAGNKKELNDAEKAKLAKLKEEQDKLKANRLANTNTNTNTNTRTRDTDFFSMLKPGTAADINMPIEGRSIDNFKKEQDRLKAAFGIKDEFYDEGKANNINMALIQAGLGIAGGTSANALENISKGSLPALEAFNKEQARLTGAQRLENLAAMNAYSEEAKEIRGYQAALLDRFYQNEAAKAARKGDDHDKAHTLTMKYLADNLPGGIPRNYGGRYGDATDDYRRVYEVMLDTVISGKPITKAQAESMRLLGGTGKDQQKSKLKLVP